MLFEHLLSLETFVPTFMAVIAVVFFTKKTQWLSYTTVTLAIISEAITSAPNVIALIACISCFAGLLLMDYFRNQGDLEVEEVLSKQH